MFDPEITNYSKIISKSIFDIILSINIIILLLWLVVLFRVLIRFRKRNCVNRSQTQEAHLNAMNNKVEYYMNVFIFAIALLELLSSALAIGLSTVFFLYLHGEFSYKGSEIFHPTIPIAMEYNNTSNHDSPWRFFPQIWLVYHLDIPQILMGSFSICIVLTFTLVYTQMSYYAMVTKISLNYTKSLKLVNLGSKQKLLLYGSVCMAMVLFLSIVFPVFILKEPITLLIFLVQFALTIHNRKEVLQAFKWKIQDTKIAFGDENILYKDYVKRLRYFKFISLVHSGTIACFLLAGATRLFRNILQLFLSHSMLYEFKAEEYINGLTLAVSIMYYAEEICLTICFVLILGLNVATLPSLLSKVNYTCYCSCKRRRVI